MRFTFQAMVTFALGVERLAVGRLQAVSHHVNGRWVFQARPGALENRSLKDG